MQSAKVASADDIEVEDTALPPPSRLRPRRPRRLPGLLAFFPDSGRHYAYNRTAFGHSPHFQHVGRIGASSTNTNNATVKLSCAQRLTPKQQRRLDKRRAQERELKEQSSPLTATTQASTFPENVTQVAQTIRFVDCFPQEKQQLNQPTVCSASTCRGDDDGDAATEATTAATPPALSPQATSPPPRLHTNDVICLALLDIQHQQAYSRRLLSRIVSLCQPKEPTMSSSPLKPLDDVTTETTAAPGAGIDSSNTGNNDNDVTKRRIHCWILLQSSVPSSAMPSMDLVDEWLQHSGVTLLVFNESNEIDNLDPTSTVSTDRDNAVDNDCLAAETLDATAQTPTSTVKVAPTENAASSLNETSSVATLPPVPFSSWLWTALGIHQCPSVTILDVATGRRLATHQEQVLLQDYGHDSGNDDSNSDDYNDKWTREEVPRIREAWLDRRTTAATTATTISNALCNVQ